MLFVNSLQKKFPIWSDRQRNREREKDIDNRPSLDELIADILDESRCSDIKGSKSDTTKALYSSQKGKSKIWNENVTPVDQEDI